jgi:hypothetical protein
MQTNDTKTPVFTEMRGVAERLHLFFSTQYSGLEVYR